MPRKMKLALASNLILASAMIAAGITYLLAPKLLPYHEQVLAVSWGEIPPRFQEMFLALLRGVGVGALAGGIAVGVLSLIPLRRGEGWARGLIAALGLINLLPALYFTLKFKFSFGASTPWPLPLAAAVFLILGFVLSRRG
ncbi:MAG: hypothetical protein ACT4NX_07845 [Deltaproteobacteria bacterium]